MFFVRHKTYHSKTPPLLTHEIYYARRKNVSYEVLCYV